jgi:hypothetical protein
MLQELGNIQSEAMRMRREAAIEKALAESGIKVSFPAGKGKAGTEELDYKKDR